MYIYVYVYTPIYISQVTCGAKQVCFARKEQGPTESKPLDNDTTFRIFDRVMHLRPKADQPTIVCPRSSRTDKIDVLIQQCKSCEGRGSASCKDSNYTDLTRWTFAVMYESSWSGYQRANLLDCEELAARIDAQCAWNDSWLFHLWLQRVYNIAMLLAIPRVSLSSSIHNNA